MKFISTNGSIYTLNRDVIVKILEDAGILKELILPAPKPEPTRWSIVAHDSGRYSINAKCSRCTYEMRMFEREDPINNLFFHPITTFEPYVHCGVSEQVPHTIKSEYLSLRKAKG